ncbi:flavodoxin family protein [Anaeromicrobium sediminis]|uniref:Flavodoxin n=1 Tax=Anaeromicrobium sediminis TaxID=1478221 RepID=A0A267MEA4_9FIRM|nr:flavodoxin domain-containing protein [Anaeromicrobium sediminis]PAB57130.1 flavodoxin [Anaeromicrobium sediminis]
MKTAVRYFTRTGNTKKLAEVIAREASVEALPVTEPLTEDVDTLFLASSVYGAGVAGEVKTFLANIGVQVGEIVNISSAAIIESTYAQVKKIAEKNGLKMSTDEYHCRGQFTLMHKGRPNAEDLQEAAAFAKRYLKR